MPNPRSTPGTAAPNPAPPARGRRAHARPPADERIAGGGENAAGRPAPPAARGSRWTLRPRSVRARILCLLMVPVVSLLAFWAFAAVRTAQDIAGQRQSGRVDTQVRAPVTAAADALQQERKAALAHLAQPDGDSAGYVADRARRSERAVDRLRRGGRHTVADGMGLPATAVRGTNAFVGRAADLSGLRERIAAGRVSWDDAYDAYTGVVGSALSATGVLAEVADVRGGGRTTHPRVLLETARARELLAREDALLTAGRLKGTFDPARHSRFTGTVEARRAFEEASATGLRGADRARWRAISEGRAYARVRAVEEDVLRLGPGHKAADAASAAAWEGSYDTLRADLRELETGAFASGARNADPLAHGLLSGAGTAVLLGLAAVIASLVISVRIGRDLIVELVSLRNDALELARHKLPQAMRRLRTGKEIDIDAEVPHGPPAVDEIGQVAEALGSVHRAALTAAAERAELASGVSGVFVNLARRSQVLVHRQLALLDRMERRAEDPGELGDLFRLDHLTTRMRRHAESLIILSGAAPGRAWRLPVPLTTVVRAAVSEVEDYPRIEVCRLPEASVAGGAVADLTHLLAELVENAAQFSPPQTMVRVSGEFVGNGFALEVEDRGLGMGTETLRAANRRIAETEAFDLVDSDRLGLFVVSRLAARHGVKVSLRPSPYGGTSAVVLLPPSLLRAAAQLGGERAGVREGASTATAAGTAGPHGEGPVADGLSDLVPDHVPDGLDRAEVPVRAVETGLLGRGPVRVPGPRTAPDPLATSPVGRYPASCAPASYGPASSGPVSSGPVSSGRTAPLAPGVFPHEAVTPSERAVSPFGPAARAYDVTGSCEPVARDSGGTDDAGDSGDGTAEPAPRPGLPARTPRSSPRSRTSATPEGGTASAPGDSGLPRRIRQASLAPQLRTAPEPEERDAPAGSREEPGDRTPEQVRDRMTAFRNGWIRGGASAAGASEGDQE
ncbi:nitrate- and nitrite sensing domain-containing protein [Streptomyces sp. NPDC048639]|uniref:sensor histidine kinase n=1 Tax=Streptomyces sp. NPDC048639 TaxID=3365581 RepID=UPI0037123CE0